MKLDRYDKSILQVLQTEGRISNESPVGRALMGRRVGEKVSVKVPSGTLEYTIKSIA